MGCGLTADAYSVVSTTQMVPVSGSAQDRVPVEPLCPKVAGPQAGGPQRGTDLGLVDARPTGGGRAHRVASGRDGRASRS